MKKIGINHKKASSHNSLILNDYDEAIAEACNISNISSISIDLIIICNIIISFNDVLKLSQCASYKSVIWLIKIIKIYCVS